MRLRLAKFLRNSARMKTAIPQFLIALLIACLGVSQNAKAVSPAPDGGYPNGDTAEGTDALFSLTTGSENTAIGASALFLNTIGGNNTAIGFHTLNSNSSGSLNTAVGSKALRYNTTGMRNTADGTGALLFNTTGDYNTAVGDGALHFNTTASANTAVGENALVRNTTASNNTAIGNGALFNNTTGGDTAIGSDALFHNTTGGGNIALGRAAGRDLTTGDFNIDIGNHGVAGEAGTIRIGSASQTRTFIAGISGTGVTGAAVQVNAAGQLGTAPSSARFKDEIRPMDKASEAILALQPVTFRYKKEIDPAGTQQFGLVAEEVEKVSSDLVVHGEKGKPYTVRYDAVNAMLLNEFLKEHKAFLEEQRKVEEQEKTIVELKSGMTALAATAKEQAAQIQKVSAQLAAGSPSGGGLEASKPAPQVVNNP
jgi:hypothetical protein